MLKVKPPEAPQIRAFAVKSLIYKCRTYAFSKSFQVGHRVMSALSAYTIFFIYNTSVSSNPIMKQHPQSANNAILTITILGQLAAILLTELTNLVSEKYRWKRVSSKSGISFLSFLVMGSVSSFNSVTFHASHRYFLVRPETTKETQTLSFPYISKVSSLQSFVKLIS
jgi:hypothetical protein